MNLKEFSQNQNSSDYSASDVGEMFLGAIIGGVVDPDEIEKVRVEYFSSELERMVYKIAHDLQEVGSLVDYISVFDELKKHKGASVAKDALHSWVERVPENFNSNKAREMLEEVYTRRKALDSLERTRVKILQQPRAAAELAYYLYEEMEALVTHKEDFDLSGEIDETVKNLMENRVKLIVPTGIGKLDRVIGGFSTQEVTIIGARPGHGKTTTAVNFCLSILRANPDITVCLFECEMSKESIKRKFISSLSGVSSFKMRINEITPEDHAPILHASEKLKEFAGRFYIYDNIYDMFMMNKVCRTVGAKVAIVDFITMMEEAQELDVRRGVGKIAFTAKRFAKAHDMAYILYSQLNRGPEARETHRPQQSDLSESDVLTQLASEILLLFYPFKYTTDPSDKRKLRVIVDKARYAGLEDVHLYFDPDLVILKDS